jgi:regulator of RNase E activity RraA
MTQAASARGVAATVVHGVSRDTDACARTGYPMWTLGRFMRTGKDRVRLSRVQGDLRIDGVLVRPDDLVCCDGDGVVVVPADRADEVARIAAAIDETERLIVEAVARGATLADARAAHGYHALQAAPRAESHPAGQDGTTA